MIDLTQFVKISKDDADINLYVSRAEYEKMKIEGRTIVLSDDNPFKDLFTKNDKFNLIEFIPIDTAWKDTHFACNDPVDEFGNIKGNDLLSKDPHRKEGDKGNDEV